MWRELLLQLRSDVLLVEKDLSKTHTKIVYISFIGMRWLLQLGEMTWMWQVKRMEWEMNMHISNIKQILMNIMRIWIRLLIISNKFHANQPILPNNECYESFQQSVQTSDNEVYLILPFIIVCFACAESSQIETFLVCIKHI